MENLPNLPEPKPESDLKQPIELVREVHHWIIEEPEGPLSLGNCINCGAQKYFRNFLPDFDSVLNSEQVQIREEQSKYYR